ncbi:glutamyl-tRNA reductase [Clostridium sp. D2Q-14]|uniref:glutamyl-tRNA reductase n=1 Tax=Anaeromonas gelatinilytica TaxID=2683194 RepID=UPI00193B0D16|nr:glutamyl-tRNA reductase [Anaeromonas gelatinilytica]MBS4535480.1 glutamyl-tRNA reductase [Anaeromonas gelatinilytica]
MDISVIGINHDTAPTTIREKASFTSSQKVELLNELLDCGIEEVAILATCNRSEIYIAHSKKDTNSHIKIVKEYYKSKILVEGYERYLFVKKGREAVEHLFCVTAGLKSVVIGEDQILGQVKEAITTSMEIGASKKILNKVFREAITTAKEIKKELKISEKPLSVSYIGIKYLEKNMGNLTGKKALMIGFGEMGKLALNHLLEEGVENIYIANRNIKKIYDEFPKHNVVKPIDFDSRYEIIKDVDMIICSTSAPHKVLKCEDMPIVNRNIYILDMAMPTDVDNKIGELENVFLYDIDDLKEMSKRNLEERKKLSRVAGKIISKEIIEFYEWLEIIKIDPIIKEINDVCKEVEVDTLNYINRKIDLDCREKKIIEKMLSSALKRVIRNPVLKLKEEKNDEKVENYMEMLDYLFDLKMGS